MSLYTQYYEKNEKFWNTIKDIEDPKNAADFIRCHFLKNSPLLYGISVEEIGFWCKEFAKFAEDIQHTVTSNRFNVILKFKFSAILINFDDRKPDDQKKIFAGPRWIKSFVKAKQSKSKRK